MIGLPNDAMMFEDIFEQMDADIAEGWWPPIVSDDVTLVEYDWMPPLSSYPEGPDNEDEVYVMYEHRVVTQTWYIARERVYGSQADNIKIGFAIIDLLRDWRRKA